MTIYKSKIGFELVLFLAVILGGAGIAMANTNALPGVVVILVVAGFIAHLMHNTFYQVDNSQLHIRCGFLYNSTLDISTIKSIKSTRNLFSSPAASIDRIEISYNRFDKVIISPKDKAGFIRHLLLINPGIQASI